MGFLPSLLDHRNTSGKTPLMYTETLANVRLLVDAGANPDLTDASGKTALDMAGERMQPWYEGYLLASPELVSYLKTVTTHQSCPECVGIGSFLSDDCGCDPDDNDAKCRKCACDVCGGTGIAYEL